ncbi:hypothetical protein M422DRAFT_779742 [Sphaerobolus stellatus SS14]|uniref:Uncharacterized protein n=1 Tax=Sphaerobolus stellatus (strain SS14) TaxID=990650 RepID=A0A0C9VYG6_SPHS4|nr:hypothetical protein M422DRAFT_779742 [Sphaerobolus stellatus SS14]
MHSPSDTDIFSPNGPTIDGKQFANSLMRTADHFSPQKITHLKRRQTLHTRDSTSLTPVHTRRMSWSSAEIQSTGHNSTHANNTLPLPPAPGTPNPNHEGAGPNHNAGTGTDMGIAPHNRNTTGATNSQQGLAPGTHTPHPDNSPPANINHTILEQALARPFDGFPMAALTMSEIQERNTPQCQTTWSTLEGRKVLTYSGYCKINLDPTIMQAPIQTKISALLSHPVHTRLGVPSDRFQGGYLSGDAPRFPPGTFSPGTTPCVNHPQGVILCGIHPQHIRRLLWPESGRFGWRQWSSGGGYMRI